MRCQPLSLNGQLKENKMDKDFYKSLDLPVIAAPLFLISGPEMVIECCKNGIVGTFPALNQRTTEGFEDWVIQIKDALALFEKDTGKKFDVRNIKEIYNDKKSLNNNVVIQYAPANLVKENIEYSVIPGPSSVINSLLLSGFPINKFMFLGFLPRKDSERKRVFENNIKNDATLVFFESPKRLVKTLSVMQKIYPSHRRAVICREMTKKHEEVIRGSISEIFSRVSSRDIKGEICLVIEGDKDLTEPSIDLDNEIKDLILRKMSPSEAAKLLSSITQQNKRDLYKWLTKKS